MKTTTAVSIAALALVVGVVIGASTASKPEAAPTSATQVIEKTPEACTNVIDLDNTIYGKIGDTDWTDANSIDATTQYIKDHTTERKAWVADCRGQA